MRYRFWHPIAIAGGVLVGMALPDPWFRLLAITAALVVLGWAMILLRHARRLLTEADAIRGEAVALKARVDAYAAEVTGIVERRGPPRPH
jgi:hypothetical protein